MSYKSKRTITSMSAGVLLCVGYLIYALGSRAPEAGNLKGWAALMLAFIGISVGALIVIQILFHIGYSIGVAVKEQNRQDKEVERIVASAMVEDEMEKTISLKSSHIGYICCGGGFLVMLVALAIGISAVVALHILFGSFLLGSLAEGGFSIYLYESGVRHG